MSGLDSAACTWKIDQKVCGREATATVRTPTGEWDYCEDHVGLMLLGGAKLVRPEGASEGAS